MEAAPRSERVSLSRDLSEFLVELSIALHRHSMYPSGHPALVPAIESVTRRAEKLLAGPPADRLRRRAAAVDHRRRDDGSRTAGAAASRRRAAPPSHRRRQHHARRRDRRSSARRSMRCPPSPTATVPSVSRRSVSSWPHVKVHPLTFDGLALVGDAPVAAGGQDSEHASHGAELWIGLARAALASDGTEGGAGVVRAVGRRQGDRRAQRPRRSVRPGHRRIPPADRAAS